MPSSSVDLITYETLEEESVASDFLCSIFNTSDSFDCTYRSTEVQTSTIKMPDLSNSGLNLAILNTFLPLLGKDGCLISEVFQCRSQEQEFELMRMIADSDSHVKYCELINHFNGHMTAEKQRSKLTFQSMHPKDALSAIHNPDAQGFPL